MIYATGDTHGNFQRFAPEHFPEQAGMTKEDYMLICGDYTVKNIMPKPFMEYHNKPHSFSAL